MTNIIGNMIKGNANVDDKLIACSMLATGKAAADMYLNATLTSSTPELRAAYSASVVQMIEGHTALTELCINRGWIKPYETPSDQLSCAFNHSKCVLEDNK